MRRIDEFKDLSTESIETWLRNIQNSIAAGANVGQINHDKAHRFRMELIRRTR